ncbi:MAG: putative glutamine amidotransferase [Moorella sp. (in: firmicutes)]|jgi:putative glutamine amidotransferase|uniref:gamma-glutamyl-gamma-aminobutyrate hydrolase family protein n=1 Tax=unclassified Neomoorella TaxID=2676739 RepID=UPI0010FFBA21|nr:MULTISPECIES: gamma-glutamyl-gamma-aminobutyrate hydrolase family protein [unclassified Moorella (in: firmicutes)]MDK2817485.1 putative glutamine amidotransferase [Moorella sp. (in: firmicutes)]GEA14090.1 peptidase C26 [Moorella sp. E308F]GEA18534.1 peptidase C26 [Moorella sp. E306M]
MAAPRIGVTCDLERGRERAFLRATYLQAITVAGGLPVLLPPVNPELAAGYLAIIDGLLLTGGGDIEPSFFNARPQARLYKVIPERDAFELALTRAALAAGKPVLAICRGIQVLNVAAGGDLYQDIKTEVPDALEHTQAGPREEPSHDIKVLPGTRLVRILGVATRVNSLHHQAVRRVGKGLRVSAVAPDGLIEALEGEGKAMVIGVQWHPEDLYCHDQRQKQLFEYFIEQLLG